MTWITDTNVGEISTTTGLGPLFLAGAIVGVNIQYIAYDERCQNGDMFIYTAQHTTLAEWEEGIGQWNAGGAVTRLSVIKSSNGGALVSFSAGTKNVTIGMFPRQPAPAYSRNLLVNGGFQFAMRQDPLVPSLFNQVGGRHLGLTGPDFWFFTNSTINADYASVDTVGGKLTNLRARYYGRLRKNTNSGKLGMGQILGADETLNLRGQAVRFSIKQRRTPNALTTRLGMIVHTGTEDVIPWDTSGSVFISAYGAAGTDPTLGTNLAYVAPVQGEGGAIVGNAVSCVLTAQFERYTGTFIVPDTAINLIPFVWTNGLMAVNDIWHFSEAGLYDTEDVEWTQPGYIDELKRCQSRFVKTFPINVGPASGLADFAGVIYGTVERAGAVMNRLIWTFPDQLLPGKGGSGVLLTTYNPSAVNAQVYNATKATSGTATSSSGQGTRSAYIEVTGAAGWAVGDLLTVHAAADTSL